MPTRNIWRWSHTNNRRKTVIGGEYPTKAQAIAAAEAAHEAGGYHGTVTTITSPKGIEFTYRPHGRASGKMVWERS